MPDFPIVDSHVHLYDPAALPYRWLRGDPVLDRRRTLREFDAAHAGPPPVVIERLVFVEVAVDAGHHLDEAAQAQAWADADPRIGGIVAHAPVERGDAVEADLARMAGLTRLRGVRRLIQGEVDPGICLAPGFVAGVRAVGRAGLSFDLCVKHWGLVFAAELARRCPETSFVLDHVGKPGIAHGLRQPWWSQLRAIAALPNVACKLSGLVTEADAQWTAAQVVPYLAHAVDCFGFARLMYGSDWPVSERTHRVADWIALIEQATAGCSADETHALFRGTATRLYRLDDVQTTTLAPTAR